MFERKQEKLAPVSVFVKRMAVSTGTAGILISVALFLGMTGYHWIAGFDWIDSLLEASMIRGNGACQSAYDDRSKEYLRSCQLVCKFGSGGDALRFVFGF
jgi:hypothetical protein